MGSEVSQSAHLGQSAGLKDFHFVGWLTDLDATIKADVTGLQLLDCKRATINSLPINYHW